MNRPIFLLIILSLITMPLFALRGISESYQAETDGNYVLAHLIMQELLEQDKNEPFFQIRSAWLLYQMGKHAEALVSYQNANRLRENIDANIGIINCQLALGNWKDALSLGSMQVKLHPENTTLLGKAAYAAYMIKDYAKAAQFYTHIFQVYPWDMENRGYLVNNLYLSGDINGAKEHFRLLKKYYPQSAIITIYKGILE
ncbi:MAG: hypothetical protein Q8J62_08465 [Candidatus Cloacimonadaceae bacterium]|nr:hypothetical protein [Candidatus Cloacimonadaceae bacterium]